MDKWVNRWTETDIDRMRYRQLEIVKRKVT
jgi:hypothetical protein